MPDEATGPSGRSGRRSRAGGDGGVFGVQVTDIWNDSLAEELGLQPRRSRKKQRARERWRWAAQGLGLQPRACPPCDDPPLFLPPAARGPVLPRHGAGVKGPCSLLAAVARFQQP